MSEIPKVMAEQIAQATLRVGGQPAARGQVRVNIYLDVEVAEYFKAEAGGRGYQTLINEMLKDSIRATGLETVLRPVSRAKMNMAG